MPTLPPSARRLQTAMAPGRRSNPSPKPPWPLQRRHAEGGPWFTVDRLWAEEGVEDWVLAPPVAFDHGDLLRLLSPEGRVSGFWVQTLGGLRSAGRVVGELGPHGRDWEAAWEGPGAKADDLLQASTGVDRRRVVRAACDCAETALPYVPEGEESPREAIEAARAWARGEASVAQVQRAVDGVLRAGAEVSQARAAAYAAANAAHATYADSDTDRASYAAAYAAYAEVDRDAAARALSPLVRRWIPLSVALLGRTGSPTPLDLGF